MGFAGSWICTGGWGGSLTWSGGRASEVLPHVAMTRNTTAKQVDQESLPRSLPRSFERAGRAAGSMGRVRSYASVRRGRALGFMAWREAWKIAAPQSFSFSRPRSAVTGTPRKTKPPHYLRHPQKGAPPEPGGDTARARSSASLRPSAGGDDRRVRSRALASGVKRASPPSSVPHLLHPRRARAATLRCHALISPRVMKRFITS